MAVTLTEVVRQFKTDWTKCLEPVAILNACRDVGHSWRERILNPVVLVHVFLLQILHGNTACQHLRHLAGIAFTAGGYCQARIALPLAVFQRLLRRVSQRINGGLTDATWHGHRTLYMDGTGFSMPDTPELQAEFGQPGGQRKGCGFPVAHLLTLFHAGTGMLLDVFTAPLRTHDMAMAAEVHPSLKPNDVLVADRGFCSYAHFALLLQGGVHAVMRMHQKMLVDFTPRRPHAVRRHGRRSASEKGLPTSRWIRTLGSEDQVVMWMKPVLCPTWMTAEQFHNLADGIQVRELRYRVHIPGFRVQIVTLATTLLDADLYSRNDLADLYRLR
jgi:putative transposase